LIASTEQSTRIVTAMEVRQLQAFVAVATELHFGRAAERLHVGQATLSESIRRLERDVGTPLFTRTTRRVALTAAGSELLDRAKVILDGIDDARAAVRRIGSGEGGTVRVGITPPVAPVLAPYLVELFSHLAPRVVVDVQRMWLPVLEQAVADGTIDVALTCGVVEGPADVVAEVFCAEPLLVALRPTHRLAAAATLSLADLAHDVLGTAQANLFPAWALSEQQALTAAGLAPPVVELRETDLAAHHWVAQDEAEWIMLIPSLVGGTRAGRPDVLKRLDPEVLVPFTLQWAPDRAPNAAVARFVHAALTADLPPGWRTQPGHLGHEG
jgi:DNA-binding transcriptional LysR family regulator